MQKRCIFEIRILYNIYNKQCMNNSFLVIFIYTLIFTPIITKQTTIVLPNNNYPIPPLKIFLENKIFNIILILANYFELK